ncbi:MAG: hypothetical protein GY696_25595, partial [Gammaproteobacteria bacterium]|nr:hypothetical protein [Gammaproteobacteria bacterium]
MKRECWLDSNCKRISNNPPKDEIRRLQSGSIDRSGEQTFQEIRSRMSAHQKDLLTESIIKEVIPRTEIYTRGRTLDSLKMQHLNDVAHAVAYQHKIDVYGNHMKEAWRNIWDVNRGHMRKLAAGGPDNRRAAFKASGPVPPLQYPVPTYKGKGNCKGNCPPLGDDGWVDLRVKLDRYPPCAVMALDRPLRQEDGTFQKQAVGLWYKDGEAVMGRAYEVGALLGATFGWENKEFSGDVGSVQIQCY